MASPGAGGLAASSIRAPAPPPVPSDAVKPDAAEKHRAVVNGGRPCPACGAVVPPNFQFCGVCGHPLESTNLPPPPPAKTAGRTRGSLVIIRPDGSEGDRVELRDQTVVGRSHGEPFASDMYLSPKHAFFFFRDDSLFVQDVSSLNGVYLRITPDVPHPLADRAIFRIGQEIIRFERMLPPELDEQGVETMGSPNPGYLGRIALVTGRESVGNSYCIPSEGMHLGRERGDIIFPDDGYVSGLHCRVHGKPDQVWVTDVGSSNGTLVRVDKESVVLRGTIVLLGQQLFRADY